MKNDSTARQSGNPQESHPSTRPRSIPHGRSLQRILLFCIHSGMLLVLARLVGNMIAAYASTAFTNLYTVGQQQGWATLTNWHALHDALLLPGPRDTPPLVYLLGAVLLLLLGIGILLLYIKTVRALNDAFWEHLQDVVRRGVQQALQQEVASERNIKFVSVLITVLTAEVARHAAVLSSDEHVLRHTSQVGLLGEEGAALLTILILLTALRAAQGVVAHKLITDQSDSDVDGGAQ